ARRDLDGIARRFPAAADVVHCVSLAAADCVSTAAGEQHRTWGYGRRRLPLLLPVRRTFRRWQPAVSGLVERVSADSFISEHVDLPACRTNLRRIRHVVRLAHAGV